MQDRFLAETRGDKRLVPGGDRKSEVGAERSAGLVEGFPALE
jgi:hypothetical protein